MTGVDLRAALSDVEESTLCLVPDVCLSEGRFLDGLTLEDLPHSVMTVPTTGHDLRSTLERLRTRGLSRV
jgi:hypothetical protein